MLLRLSWIMGMAMAPAALAGEATSTTVDSVAPGDPSITGTSTLVRNNNGVSMTFEVVGLAPGNGYSAWFSVNGFPPPAAQAGRRIAGEDGTASFSGRLAEGDLLGNAATDDVLIVILNHRPKDPGNIRQQMTDVFTCGGPCPPVIHAEHKDP